MRTSRKTKKWTNTANKNEGEQKKKETNNNTKQTNNKHKQQKQMRTKSETNETNNLQKHVFIETIKKRTKQAT